MIFLFQRKLHENCMECFFLVFSHKNNMRAEILKFEDCNSKNVVLKKNMSYLEFEIVLLRAQNFGIQTLSRTPFVGIQWTRLPTTPTRPKYLVKYLHRSRISYKNIYIKNIFTEGFTSVDWVSCFRELSRISQKC